MFVSDDGQQTKRIQTNFPVESDAQAFAISHKPEGQLALPFRLPPRRRAKPVLDTHPRARRVSITVGHLRQLLVRRAHVGVTIAAHDLKRIRDSGPCHYCRSLELGVGLGVDRLDNDRGYEAGNLVPCCAWCNRARGYLLSPEEFAAAMAVRLSKAAGGDPWAGHRDRPKRAEPADVRDRSWARRGL